MDYLSYGYAGAILLGALCANANGSKTPMVICLIFGAILAFGAHQTSQNPNNVLVPLVASTVLAGLMGTRYYKLGKLPAGMVAVLCLTMVARFGYRLAVGGKA